MRRTISDILPGMGKCQCVDAGWKKKHKKLPKKKKKNGVYNIFYEITL